MRRASQPLAEFGFPSALKILLSWEALRLTIGFDIYASRIFFLIGAISLILAAGGLESARAARDGAPRPHRIVSINMCTDHLALQLADRNHILSVTFSSADPGQSLIADQIDGIELNSGQAEQIILLNPDLILSGAFTTSFTNLLLKRLGYNVVEIPFPENLEDARRNIRLAARAIGVPQRGEDLIAELDRRLDQALSMDLPRDVSVLILAAGGLTHGAHTLAGDLLTQAGVRNSATDMGIGAVRNVSLETILRVKPDVIVLSKTDRANQSLSSAWLDHPALRRYLKERHAVDVPWSYLGCETPYLGEALRRITQSISAPGAQGAP